MSTGELLERDKELGALREAIGAKGGPRGRLLAIQGSAGMGKTRLLAAARDVAGQSGLRVLSARGSALERSFAFGIVRQLFEPVLRRSPPGERGEILDGAAMLALPVLESAPVDSAKGLSEEGALSLRHGLFWLAANLADRQPLLLAVDDLHWSDVPSLDWLGYLLRRLEGLPIVVAVAFRPAEPGMDSVLVNELMGDPLAILLRPRPLSAAATRQLTEQILGADPCEEFCAACLQASGGNPLLLNELLNALAEEGVAPEVGEIPRVREIGPGAVSRSVRRRLAQLPTEAQTFARALAVLGDEADLDLIAALAAVDHEKAANAAEMLARVDLIHREPALAFVHALVRDAVYLEMPVMQRREYHKRAGAILTERGASARRTAAQLLLSPRSGSQQLVATLRQAARDALARSAPANAAVYLSRALDEPPLPEVRGALLFELGAAEALMRDREAEVHLQAALANTRDPSTRAEIALALARLLFWRNATTEAVALLEQGSAGLTERHAELRTRLEAEMAGIALSDSTMHAAVAERLSRVVDLPADSAGGRMLLAYAALRDTLRGEDRERCIERAELALVGPELFAEEASMSFLAVIQVLLYADQLDRVLQVMREARSLAERRGTPGSYAIASMGIVRVLHDMGRLLEAEAEADGVLEACPEDQPVARAYVATTLAHVLLKRGDLVAAERALAEGGLDRGSMPRSLFAANPLTVHGLLHSAQGDWPGALADFVAIGDLLEPAGCRNPAIARWRSGAALALVHLGRQDEARTLAEEELDLSRAWGAPTMIGRSLRALGLVEGGTRGLGLLEDAVRVLATSPAAYELLKTQVELGAGLRRANQRAAARDLLRAGLDRAERSGAGLLAGQAREELLATGARPRRLVLTGVASLTASERRVATMARDGMTNREIAQALFVTTKTVETHLAHVFTKLDIRSRTELGTQLAE